MKKNNFFILLVFIISFNNVFSQSGQFGQPHIINGEINGLSPSFYSVKDMDNDGDNDLILITVNKNNIYYRSIVWYQNVNGQGDFGKRKVIVDNEEKDILDFDISDIDGDNDNDIILGQKNCLLLYKNIDGKGNFPSLDTITTFSVNYVMSLDIDHDGDLDLLIATSGKIGWLKNLDGKGTFDTLNILSETYIKKIEIADINNDGKKDIVVLSSSQSIYWLKNLDNLGGFDSIRTISDEFRYTSFTTLDVDNDGDQDILVSANDYYKNVGYYENTDSLCSFNSYHVIQTPYLENITTLNSVDIDNDGDIDIIGASNMGAFYCSNTDNDTTFSTHFLYSAESVKEDIICENINNDGKKDMIILSDLFVWMENNGEGFGNQHLIDDVENERINSYDVDNDGDQDILSIGSYNKIFWYENVDGEGNYSIKHVISTDYSRVYRVTMFDIDSDGDLDLFVEANVTNISWYENDGTGSFITKHIAFPTESNYFRELCFTDINADGHIDIILGDNTRLKYWKNDGENNFNAYLRMDDYNYDKFDYIKSVDLNQDGFLDIVALATVNWTKRIIWYKNNQKGVFEDKGQIIAEMENLSDIKIENIDDDDNTEIIITSGYNRELFLLKDTSGNQTYKKIIIDNNVQPGTIFIADIDNDNKKDILTDTDKGMYWYKNFNNNDIFEPKRNITKSTILGRYSFTDINNDGLKELLFTSFHNIYWYPIIEENKHEESKSTHKLFNTTTPYYIAVGDIDGDEDLDILTSANFKDINCFYNKDGLGDFSFPETIISSNAIINGISFLDMDNDGYNELLIPTTPDVNGTNSILVYKNHNGTISNQADSLITNIPGSISPLLICDIDGDKDMDITYSAGGKLYWIENIDNFSTFTQHKISNNGFNFLNYTDIDNDGDNDLLCTGDTLFLYENDGLGTFTKTFIDKFGCCVSLVGVYGVDLNNDGYKDILSCLNSNGHESINWYEHDGDSSTYSDEKYISTCNGNIYPYDINKDGFVDIVSGGLIYLNDGHANFDSTYDLQPSESAKRIIVEDIDNDIDGDIIFLSGFHVGWYEDFLDNNCKIEGMCFFDANQNGIKDSSEIGIGSAHLQLNPNSIFSFSDKTGFFRFTTVYDNYTLSCSLDSNWSMTSDSTQYHVNLTKNNPIVDNLNFGFYPDTFFTSINPELTISNFRCGEKTYLWANYQNTGTKTSSGIVELILDHSITYISSELTPDSTIGNKFYWHFDSLNVFAQNTIDIEISMPDFNKMGDTLRNILNIYTNDTTNQYFFTDTLSEELLCSYDPNDKLVSPKGEGIKGVVSKNETLKYTIRFQNTGNAEAINVKIRDKIDKNLNIESLKILASSYDVKVHIQQKNWLVFQFDSIMLPDSSSNFLKSQGFVKYEIKLKDDVLPNTPIRNSANIYFDNNHAIITNTILNTVECYDIPETPDIIQDCDLLHVETDNSIQWFLNNNEILNATDSVCQLTQSGNYSYIITDKYHCDFSSKTSLFEKKTNAIDTSIAVCDQFNWNGVNYTTSGTPTQTFTNINGCDSVVTVNLTINTVDVSVSMSVEGTILYAKLKNANYQWIDCENNNKIIEGETNYSFKAKTGGSYAVIINDGSCIDTSICYNIIMDNINIKLSNINIYPNPTNDIININGDNIEKIEIINTNGILIKDLKNISKYNQYDLNKYSKGVYIVKVTTKSNVILKRIILK